MHILTGVWKTNVTTVFETVTWGKGFTSKLGIGVCKRK